MCPDAESRSALPPFLQQTEPMEPDALPLQVALLTMELAEVRIRLAELGRLLGSTVAVLRLPGGGFLLDESDDGKPHDGT